MPVSVKAASGDFDYQESTMSVADTKAYVVAGIDDVAIGVILVIIGFIVMTYCTLRNVNVPVSYSSSDSFIDKCKQIGQFAYDNMSPAITGLFKSARDFKDAHPEMNTVTAIASFTAINVVSMFRALSDWFASSFITERSEITENVLNMLAPATVIDTSTALGSLQGVCGYQWAYAPEFYTKCFNPYVSSTAPCLVWGYPQITSDTSFNLEYTVYLGPTLDTLRTWSSLGYIIIIFVFQEETSMKFEFTRAYATDGGYKISTMNTRSYEDDPCSVSANGYYFWGSSSDVVNNNLGRFSYDGNLATDGYVSMLPQFLQTLINCGVAIGICNTINQQYGLSDNNSGRKSLYAPTDLTFIANVPSIPVESIDITGNEDTYAAPDEAIWDINQIARDVSANALTLEQLKELLKDGATTISLENAITDAVTMPSGSYNVPSLDGVWKYPRYMFATLGSYITFLGTALRSVTIGEGGLSWLFYGAFVLLVCGGVIGKMLL